MVFDLADVILYITLIIKQVFWSLSNMKSKENTHVPHDTESRKNLEMFLLRKGNFILIYEFQKGVKLEKIDYLQLVYNFTVPLRDSKLVDINLMCSVIAM